jgi:putative DNA-invertase from lambdoid prophage Rac
VAWTSPLTDGRVVWAITKDLCQGNNDRGQHWKIRAFVEAISERFLAIARKSLGTTPFKVGFYARVSTHDQQTLPMQLSAMRTYAKRRGWTVALEEKEVGSGAKTRPKREEMLKAARRRELDAILVWRLDRWGRSLLDLIGTLRELHAVGVGFVSLTEALDMTTPGGRALAGMLAVFAEFERDILRDRVKAGIAQARKEGRPHGRPATVQHHATEISSLFKQGISKRQIAARLSISRASVRRMLPSIRKPPVRTSRRAA